jgi:hypothetical protein
MARKLGSVNSPTEWVIDWEGYEILAGDAGIPGWIGGEWWQAPPHFFDAREMESLAQLAKFKNTLYSL